LGASCYYSKHWDSTTIQDTSNYRLNVEHRFAQAYSRFPSFQVLRAILHRASGKMRLKKVIFENCFSNFEAVLEFFSKTKKLSSITSFYGINFRSLAKSLRKLEQKQNFDKFSLCPLSLYIWTSYSGIHSNFKISPPFLYVPKSKQLVCNVSRDSKIKSWERCSNIPKSSS
jgi:ERCC4-related helicase